MEDRLAGTLLGTAVGDALGLATEGMSARAIARRFGRVQRYHLLGRTTAEGKRVDPYEPWVGRAIGSA
jgi:ADP-ribosylglycohydrolase